MKCHKNKANKSNWSSAFKMIGSKEQFQNIESDMGQTKQKQPDKVKQQVIVPKISTVTRITRVKQFAHIPSNYIRLAPELALPLQGNYELSQVDHVFLQGQQKKFIYQGRQILTTQLLSNTIIQLQRKAKRDPIIPSDKRWILSYMQKNYPRLLNYERYNEFTSAIYNYWKNRREEQKFPLLRQLWRPEPQTMNFNLAFKPREKQKRMLRRNNRGAEENQIPQEVQQQFSIALAIARRIKMKESLKLNLIELQLIKFHKQCQKHFAFQNFFIPSVTQIKASDKQRQQILRQQVDNFKEFFGVQPQEIQIDYNHSDELNKGHSIGIFLAEVVSVAASFDICYDVLFPSQKPSVSSPIEQVKSEDEYDYLKMNIYRQGNTIYRTLHQIQNESQQNPQFFPPQDLFEYQTRNVKGYYIGSDDEGYAQGNLKKAISSSFRKFKSNQN